MDAHHQEDHDLLVTIKTQMGYVKESFARGSERMDDLAEAIEVLKRSVTAVEKRQTRDAAIAAVFGFLAGAFVNLLFNFVIG